ncbi:uncharacterized protein LOC126892541 [Diabrotica virgifera virgifera]|uniref:Uncharacterized protein LOC114327553 n=1 Tax=Diabrotica virgifera virgifera TaxID=50390 RepID=A0A6P7F8A5_DIAVI|nr:uncharacterized protein LOC114327554 [Diabrotica virgifera virgifera]XP_050518059.1 uncharacterized protein LOC126892541 [Diabrotica virgifera virgifera]
MSDSSEFEDNNTPPDILEQVNITVQSLLPQKSKERYEKQYLNFKQWAKEKHIRTYSENVILGYFSILAPTLKASTLWSKYSMLRTMLQIKENVDIKYPKVIAFLKRQNQGYKANNAKTFSREEVNKFLLDAPDHNYLLMKVLLIFGISGACRCDELVKMVTKDVEDKGSILIVNIPNTKTNMQRTFVINASSGNGPNDIEIYRKYISLRPKIDQSRLFVCYRAGKCSKQLVGKNSISKIPTKIAEFLKLPNATNYTGHSFRRTSASLLANSGGDILALKQHGGWKSTNIAEGYIEQSLAKKQKISEQIMGVTEVEEVDYNQPSTSTFGGCQVYNNKSDSENITKTTLAPALTTSGIQIATAQNCTFNININNCPTTN